MARYAFAPIVVILCLTWSAPLPAQEGHPLVGSWHGDWAMPDQADHRDLTVIMDWDGTAVTGLVNPVTDRAALENAKLDSSDWTVHFEARMRADDGERIRCVADGQIDKLGSDQRTIAGTWVCGETHAEFHLTRDRDY